MRTNDQKVIDKLTEELLQLWEQYRLALESDENFEVKKKIRMKIKGLTDQINKLSVTEPPETIPPPSLWDLNPLAGVFYFYARVGVFHQPGPLRNMHLQ